MSTLTEETASECIQKNMATAAKLHICNPHKLCRTNHCREGFTINLQATVQVLLSTHQPLYKGFSLSDHKPLYRAFHYQLTSSYTECFTINSKANVQRVSQSTNKPLYKMVLLSTRQPLCTGFHYQLSTLKFGFLCCLLRLLCTVYRVYDCAGQPDLSF